MYVIIDILKISVHSSFVTTVTLITTVTLNSSRMFVFHLNLAYVIVQIDLFFSVTPAHLGWDGVVPAVVVVCSTSKQCPL